MNLAKQGMKAAEIATHLKGRTRNSVIGLLHRRKIMMSIFQPKPYPTRLPKKRAPSKPKVIGPPTDPITTKSRDYNIDALFAEPKKNVNYGKVDLMDAHSSQCRWIEGDDRMICGDPVVKSSAWCKAHYPRVFTPYSVAKAAAAELRKRREAEKWPDRKKF